MEIGSGTSGASYVMPYLMKLCRDYNVDIVNTGHQHVLHRTHPVTFRDSVPPSRPWATVCIPVVVGPGEGTTFLCAARSELALNGGSPAYYHAIAVGSNSSGSQRIGNTGVECKRDAVYKLEIDGLVGKGYGVNSGYNNDTQARGTVFDTFTVVARPKTGGGGTRKEAKAEAEEKGSISVSPNPFKATVRISRQYAAGSRQKMEIAIYNCRGTMIEKLPTANCLLPTDITWNPAGLPAGVYLVRADIGNRILTRRITLTR
jgi:hypothetical protein